MLKAHLPICCIFALLPGCATDINTSSPPNEAATLSGITQLTRGFTATGQVCFSPDMHWILFQGMPSGEKTYQMFMAQVKDGPNGITEIGPPIRISPANSRSGGGCVSPDGLSVVFTCTAGKEVAADVPTANARDAKWNFPQGMEIFRADGWESALNASAGGRIVDLARHSLTDNKAYDAECAYSPDGNWIIFTSDRTGDLDLFAMHPDGSNVVQLTNSPGYDGGAAFSPDGKRIVYRSDRKGDGLFQIFTSELVFGPKGLIIGLGRERKLTNEGVNWGPNWHRDGRHVIYAATGKTAAADDFWLMRDDGSHKTRITFDPGRDILPAFSPDGNYLIWSSNRNGGSMQLYLAKFKMPAGA